MTENFTVTFLVDQSPKQVFDAVLDVRGWWQGLYSEEISGGTKNVNDEFTFRAGDGAHYTRQKLVEIIPNKRVVWLITECELSFIERKDEWAGTKIIFEIAEKAGKTQLQFTHQGLTPEIECYDACSSAWSMYMQEKLLPLIGTTPQTRPSANNI